MSQLVSACLVSLLSVYQETWLDCAKGGKTDSPLPHLFPAFQNWFGVLEPTLSPPQLWQKHNTSQLIICHLDWWKRQLHPTSTSEDLLSVITSSSEYWSQNKLRQVSFFGVLVNAHLSCFNNTLLPGREYSLGITVTSYITNPVLNKLHRREIKHKTL